ncbi:MAG TPA: ankyrin repeat domain-containing protein [Verrucomicrobia bacterium]|nr:ankyrin repeat domain-containing protein [Verrucomicrobiota bacterium]
MKHLLLTTIAVVVLVGCSKPPPPDISIHRAAYVGNIEAVKQHIAAGTDVNEKDDLFGRTPLHHATIGGSKEIAELLVSKGADVNAKSDGALGWNALHYAARGGHKEIAELLIAEGADVNAKDDDGTAPLDMAEQVSEDDSPEYKADKKETADLLRKHGGESGANDSIHVATRVGNIEAVKQHLAAGADVNARGVGVSTPLDWAIGNDETEITDLLRKHGGKRVKN